jgi:predicted phosphodiesterase
MIAAFLSDIHGNLPALKAAVADAEGKGAERFFCAGDLTGYGPFPSEVCRFAEKRGMTAILGNYDRKVLEAIEDPAAFEKTMKPAKWRILDWTRANLDIKARRWLAALPPVHRETLPGGFELLLVHGSAQSADDAVYPSVTDHGLKAKLGGEKPDILACGHTHIPFVKKAGGVLVINCGSAGHPVDGDPRPAYALLRIAGTSKPSARIVRFDYPKDQILAALGKTSLPKSLSKDYEEGNKKRWMP